MKPVSVLQQQHLANVIAYCRYLSVNLSGLTLQRVSIAYQTRDENEKRDTMTEAIFTGDVEPLLACMHPPHFSGKQPFPHDGYLLNYRQCVARWSLQVNIGEGKGSFDIDEFNPDYGAAPALLHWFQCQWHALRKIDTDPMRVAKALRKMGITAERAVVF